MEKVEFGMVPMDPPLCADCGKPAVGVTWYLVTSLDGRARGAAACGVCEPCCGVVFGALFPPEEQALGRRVLQQLQDVIASGEDLPQ